MIFEVPIVTIYIYIVCKDWTYTFKNNMDNWRYRDVSTRSLSLCILDSIFLIHQSSHRRALRLRFTKRDAMLRSWRILPALRYRAESNYNLISNLFTVFLILTEWNTFLDVIKWIMIDIISFKESYSVALQTSCKRQESYMTYTSFPWLKSNVSTSEADRNNVLIIGDTASENK